MARALIARVGERDLFAWWDDNAMTTAGRFVMERLFPRTAALAQVEVAIEAAASRHRTNILQPTRMTLFRLPGGVEAAITRRLFALKRGNASLPFDVDALMSVKPSSVADVLLQHKVVEQADLDATPSPPASGHILELGSVAVPDLTKPDELDGVVRRLLAGYARSSKANLVVPVLDPA